LSSIPDLTKTYTRNILSTVRNNGRIVSVGSDCFKEPLGMGLQFSQIPAVVSIDHLE